MRVAALAILLAMSVAGCLGGAPRAGDAELRDPGGGCPAHADRPAAGGGFVEVQAANGLDADACVRIYFDGVLVASGNLRGERATRPHNNPQPLASFSWEGRDVLVAVQNDATGREDSERIRLFENRTYVAAWVGKTDTTIRVYDAPPQWM